MRILFAMQALSRKAFHKMLGTEELLNDFEKKRVKWKYRELDKCDEAELENRNGALLVVTDSSNLAQTLSDRKICCVAFQKPSDTSFLQAPPWY